MLNMEVVNRMTAWVVRAGVARAAFLMRGFTAHAAVPGLFGFSVQCAPGRSVDELARAGAFPNAQVSYATDDELQGALSPLGLTMRLVASPGRGYHHTFAVLYDASGTLLWTLPPAAALALEGTFRHQPNPHRVLPGRRGPP